MKQQTAIFLWTILACGGCSSKTKPTITGNEARTLIEKQQQVFMDRFKANDSTGIANIYTADAKVMNAGKPAVAGRDSIVSFFGSIFKSGTKRITVLTNDTWQTEDMIVEDGKWIMADSNGVEYDHGKYLILWKKENGTWKKFRDCHNSDIYPLAPTPER